LGVAPPESYCREGATAAAAVPGADATSEAAAMLIEGRQYEQGVLPTMGASPPGVRPDLRQAEAPDTNPIRSSPPFPHCKAVQNRVAGASGVNVWGLSLAKVRASLWRTSPQLRVHPHFLPPIRGERGFGNAWCRCGERGFGTTCQEGQGIRPPTETTACQAKQGGCWLARGISMV
jgi:hypothetical protein